MGPISTKFPPSAVSTHTFRRIYSVPQRDAAERALANLRRRKPSFAVKLRSTAFDPVHARMISRTVSLTIGLLRRILRSLALVLDAICFVTQGSCCCN